MMKIKELTIYTSRLELQKEFYNQNLGIPILEEDESSIKLAIGSSNLILKERKQATPYHFAINIPSNQEIEALTWLQQHVHVLNDNGIELIDFNSWNAKSMYFYDIDQNIVELIARKNLFIENRDPFNYHALLSISEIGMPVENIQTTYEDLCRLGDFPIFDGGFERFCAVGDDEGLFILVDPKRKDWFPTNDQPFASPFEIRAEVEGKEVAFRFENGKIKLIPEL